MTVIQGTARPLPEVEAVGAEGGGDDRDITPIVGDIRPSEGHEEDAGTDRTQAHESGYDTTDIFACVAQARHRWERDVPERVEIGAMADDCERIAGLSRSRREWDGFDSGRKRFDFNSGHGLVD